MTPVEFIPRPHCFAGPTTNSAHTPRPPARQHSHFRRRFFPRHMAYERTQVQRLTKLDGHASELFIFT